MAGALSHIRVLDLTRILAGPWCTQNFADLGAEVIKVERPGCGDDTRHWGPPWVKDGEGDDTEDSAYFSSANRNKKSIAIDIGTAAGQQLIRELVVKCDVLVENYKVGDLARYGLGYDDIRKLNPAIVYCSITGYGQTGPLRHKPGYDFVFQGQGGLMSVTGERDELPGGGPQKVGIAVTDVITGMYASVAILAALQSRTATGVGQYIDIALLDCIVAFGSNQAVNYMTSGAIPRRYGNAHSNVVPYQVFATSDGDMVVAAGNDSQWIRFCNAIERPELAQDERFKTASGRIIHRETLLPELERIMRKKASSEWVERLDAAGIPCGPINNYQEVFADPQVQHRGLWVNTPHARGGTSPSVASPLRLSATPVEYRRAPPTLGQHTKDILCEVLGKSGSEIEQLSANGIIAC